MRLISDEQVRSVLTLSESSAVVRDAFIADARGRAASLQRTRKQLNDITLSVMGGVIEDAHVCGAKVYSTLAGKFDFVVVLFDTKDGRYLASIQGNALTEFRTAATTRVAVETHLPQNATTLTVFGAGVQAKAHIAALLELGVFKRVFINSKGDAQQLATTLRTSHPEVEFLTDDVAAAVAQADVLVTCTRSANALFDGALLKPDVFVAAIGSSKPQTRELDDVTLERAERIIVEDVEQARKEAGDLLMAKEGIVDWSRVQELGPVLAANAPAGLAKGITVYKSVGVGLVDVALSALVYRKLAM
ncbi:ornithine cyclodeaminase family protein [Paraburkholderia sp. T12-10]|nr:ornithine cyclodeaminase family protein [Paraburkholderia sp. T12-10]